MKSTKILFVLFLLIYTFSSKAQTTYKIHQLDSSLISPSLRKGLDKVISQAEEDTPLFKKGFGYICVWHYENVGSGPTAIIDSSNNTIYKKSMLNHTILVGLASYPIRLKPEHAFLPYYEEWNYPIFYMEYKNRLILFHNSDMRFFLYNNYDKESVTHIQKLIAKTLQKTEEEDFTFKDFFGEYYKLDAKQRATMDCEQLMNEGAFTLTNTYLINVNRDGTVYIERKH